MNVPRTFPHIRQVILPLSGPLYWKVVSILYLAMIMLCNLSIDVVKMNDNMFTDRTYIPGGQNVDNG